MTIAPRSVRCGSTWGFIWLLYLSIGVDGAERKIAKASWPDIEFIDRHSKELEANAMRLINEKAPRATKGLLLASVAGSADCFEGSPPAGASSRAVVLRLLVACRSHVEWDFLAEAICGSQATAGRTPGWPRGEPIVSCLSDFVPMQRKRLFRASFALETSEKRHVTGFKMMKASGAGDADSEWLDPGAKWEPTPEARVLLAAVRHLPRRRELAQATALATPRSQEQWAADEYRFPPAHDEDLNCVRVEGGQLAVRWGYTLHDRIEWLVPGFADGSRLAQGDSDEDEAGSGPKATMSRGFTDEQLLVLSHIQLGRVRRSRGHRRVVLLWDWKTVFSFQWQRSDEHINVLEARTCVSTLGWRERLASRVGGHVLDFLDSMMVIVA